MRILVAVDGHSYSDFALRQCAILASNTWADVTILLVSGKPGTPDARVTPRETEALIRLKDLFLDACPGEDHPYAARSPGYEVVETRERVYQLMEVLRPRRKELRVRLRLGPAGEEILREARDEGDDLIMMGCPKGSPCQWRNAKRVVARVVNESPCSVFIVKEERPIQEILCCLDQNEVSQDSLEIVKQLVHIHGAKLHLVGLTHERAIRIDVDRRLRAIQQYYASQEIPVEVRLQEITELEAFLSKEGLPGLLALWMSKRSLLRRFFPEDWAGKLVHSSPSSVLILR